MKLRLLILLISIATFSTSGYAGSLPGSLHIEAKKMLLLHQSNQVEFTGTVLLRRDDFELRCNKLIAHYRAGQQQLEKAEAFGEVRMHQGQTHGKADRAVLDQAKELLTLIGNASIEQNGSRIEGETITHNINQKQTMVSPVDGGRTRMLLESDEPQSGSPDSGTNP